MKNFQAFQNLQVDRDRRQCLKLFQKWLYKCKVNG